jgi:hypothetical protein
MMIVPFVLVHHTIRGAKFLLLVTFHQEADHLLHESRIQGCLSDKNVLTSNEEKVVVTADHENGLESVNV